MPEREACIRIGPPAGVVRSTVAERARHGLDDGIHLGGRHVAPGHKKAADPAHLAASPSQAPARDGRSLAPLLRAPGPHDTTYGASVVSSSRWFSAVMRSCLLQPSDRGPGTIRRWTSGSLWARRSCYARMPERGGARSSARAIWPWGKRCCGAERWDYASGERQFAQAAQGGGRGRNRTAGRGFAVPCITTLLPGHTGSRDSYRGRLTAVQRPACVGLRGAVCDCRRPGPSL